MTDREQIRRDAEKWVRSGYRNISEDLREMSETCLTLLAELEQAERERDKLAEALRWYAHESDWNRGAAGDVARAALADRESPE